MMVGRKRSRNFIKVKLNGLDVFDLVEVELMNTVRSDGRVSPGVGKCSFIREAVSSVFPPSES